STGKITPTQKEWAAEYALKDPVGFKSFTDKAPQVVPMSELQVDDKKNTGKEFDDATLTVCKALGVSKEDLEKYGKDGE
ncbi:MAG: phage protease, partial [Anaerovorax sp.]